ncbi:hypothetical protein ACOMHN_046922 [Nucella lapillus]
MDILVLVIDLCEKLLPRRTPGINHHFARWPDTLHKRFRASPNNGNPSRDAMDFDKGASNILDTEPTFH